MTAGTVRVAHQPPDHPYVRHCHADGHPTVTAESPSVWDVGAMRAAGIAVVHVHFGFEHLRPDQLAQWVGDLARAGIALVYTVHDLDNPHLVDQAPFHRSVSVLADAAAAVLTLTPAAAAAIGRDHARLATVVSHPHVVPLARLDHPPETANASQARRGLYVHAASLRPNLDLELLGELAAVAQPFGGLTVHVRADAAPDGRRPMARLAALGADVQVGPRPSDDELWDRIATARAIVLAYRWGTHSGLLEAATDLGTPALAPRFGGYRDQGAHALERDDLGGSVRRALDAPLRCVDGAERRRQRDESAAIHRRIYDDVAGGRS